MEDCLKLCCEHSKRASVAVSLPLCLIFASRSVAQIQAPPASTDDFVNKGRILGVIPNYLTVEDPTKKVAPLTVTQKFRLFAKETFDPLPLELQLLLRGSRSWATAIRSMARVPVRMGSGLARQRPILQRRTSFRTLCSHLCSTKIPAISAEARSSALGIVLAMP
jgi:hypothetical protein